MMFVFSSLRSVSISVGRMPCEIIHKYKWVAIERFRRIATCENESQSVDKFYNEWLKKFELSGISEPKESMKIIISHVVGNEKVGENHQRNKKSLSGEQVQLLNRLCECRLARVPVQYIIGEWQFRNLCLSLAPPVFIPRPETETLVDLILEKVNQSAGLVEILEVGCGSGAISLSLAQESQKVVCTAIDQSELACCIAQKNVSSYNLDNRVKIIWAKLTEEGKICKGQVENKATEDIPKKFDIVVSNPPYVPQKDMFHLQPEILLYEDLRALDGGIDGLKIIKPLLKFAANVLDSKESSKSGGTLYIEVDPSHPALLEKWLISQENPLPLVLKKVHQDLFGKDRFVEFIKK